MRIVRRNHRILIQGITGKQGTFWTERIGPSAALKTLEVMEREKSWETITKVGGDIGKRWQILAEKYELPLKVHGLPSLISFSLPPLNMLKYKTCSVFPYKRSNKSKIHLRKSIIEVKHYKNRFHIVWKETTICRSRNVNIRVLTV